MLTTMDRNFSSCPRPKTRTTSLRPTSGRVSSAPTARSSCPSASGGMQPSTSIVRVLTMMPRLASSETPSRGEMTSWMCSNRGWPPWRLRWAPRYNELSIEVLQRCYHILMIIRTRPGVNPDHLQLAISQCHALGPACTFFYRADQRGSRGGCRECRRRQVDDAGGLGAFEVLCSRLSLQHSPAHMFLASSILFLDIQTRGGLDDGRGRARVNLFRHKHEIETGRTSSVGMEVRLVSRLIFSLDFFVTASGLLIDPGLLTFRRACYSKHTRPNSEAVGRRSQSRHDLWLCCSP